MGSASKASEEEKRPSPPSQRGARAGGPDLVERGSEAEALSRPRVADIAYVRMTNGSFGYVAFVAGVFARGTVGRVCATAMDARGLPLQAPEWAIARAASHGGADPSGI